MIIVMQTMKINFSKVCKHSIKNMFLQCQVCILLMIFKTTICRIQHCSFEHCFRIEYLHKI